VFSIVIRARKQHLLRLDEFQNPGKLLMRPRFEDTLKQLGLLRGAETTQSVAWQLGVCSGVGSRCQKLVDRKAC